VALFGVADEKVAGLKTLAFVRVLSMAGRRCDVALDIDVCAYVVYRCRDESIS